MRILFVPVSSRPERAIHNVGTLLFKQGDIHVVQRFLACSSFHGQVRPATRSSRNDRKL